MLRCDVGFGVNGRWVAVTVSDVFQALVVESVFFPIFFPGCLGDFCPRFDFILWALLRLFVVVAARGFQKCRSVPLPPLTVVAKVARTVQQQQRKPAAAAS